MNSLTFLSPVLITNNCSVIKDLNAVISVFNTDIFSSREYYICFIWLQLFGIFLLMVFHSLMGVEVIHR